MKEKINKTTRDEKIRQLSATLKHAQIAKELGVSVITVKKVLSSQPKEQVKKVKETSNTNTEINITKECIKDWNKIIECNAGFKQVSPEKIIKITNQVEKEVYSKKEVDDLIAKIDKKYNDYFSILQERLDELYIKPIEKSDFGFPPELIILKDTKSLTSSQVKDILICGISIMPNRFTLGMLIQRVSIFKALTNEIIEEAMENQESVYRKENTYIKI